MKMDTVIDIAGPIVLAMRALVQALSAEGYLPPDVEVPTTCRLAGTLDRTTLVTLTTDTYVVSFSRRPPAVAPVPADEYIDWS